MVTRASRGPLTRRPSTFLAAAIAGLVTSLAAAALADDPPPAGPAQPALAPAGPAQPAPDKSPAVAPPTPEVHHAPVASSFQHEPIKIGATIDHPEQVKAVGLVYRSAQGQWRTVPFLRGVADYVAVIPGGEVEPPGLSYTIEIERVDGVVVSAFASRGAPYPIQVFEDRADAREKAALERLLGRRSVATAGGELVRFGSTTGRSLIPCGQGQEGCSPGQQVRPVVDDQYWKIEAGYTYRPLRAVAEFSLRGGVVRGQSLVGSVSVYDLNKYKVGLNYASPSVRFRLADAWHLELEALTSITEVGFSVGGGGAVLIGDPYGSKLTLGFETIGFKEQYFGSRFYSKVDLAAGDRVRLSPQIEVTDMPHAESFGVRLLGDVSVDIVRGFSATLRGGYQARRSTSGGPALGASVSLAF
jgi:hypothetical protein